MSVHIVHEYNGNTQQKSQISTNVTVNSTIKTPNSQEADVKTNVECKQEPFDDSASKCSNQSKASQNSNADIDSDLDLPTNFDNEDDIINIIDELEKFDEIYRRKVQDSETNESLNSSSEKGSMFSPEMYVDPSQTHSQTRTQPMQPYRAAAASQPVSTMSEGGLAAETLKQMAAQHQQHHPGQEQFGVKSAIDPFSDMPNTGQFNQRNGYPSEYQYSSNSAQRPPSGGAFNGQQCLGYGNKASVPPYGVTKPLTHYSQSESSGPSSLQQLQNQVAHFNHGPQMEITQTQHMQLSDGSHRMQMSQTQQIQLRQPVHNISLTQQQAFSASPNMGQSQNFMANDPMAMQQQMMQSKMHNEQRQQQAASASHMQPYMTRPPPEYKMQHTNGLSSGLSSNNIGTNPLQTIQNMVNQTNTHSNQGYSNVKTESSDLHMQNGIRTAQMTAMQQQQMSNSVNPSVGMSMAQAQMQYSNQAIQRQASFPGAMAHAQPRAQRPNTPTYTSAIMRNQRPPNVNIGPDGLNISQPRNHEWPGPRGMMPASGQRGVSPSTSAGIMQYRSYSAEGQNVNSATAAAELRMQQQQQQSTVQINAMQSQQAAMMQGNAQAQQQMMMQQQRLQMSHQMAQRPHNSQSPSYNMATPPSTSFPQASATQDDILNLLDSAPNQSTDFFDVQTSGGGTEANWYDIDDILGNPK